MFTRTFALFLRLIFFLLLFFLPPLLLLLQVEIHSPLSDISRFTFVRHQGNWEKRKERSPLTKFLWFQLICFHFSSFRASEMNGRQGKFKFWSIEFLLLACFFFMYVIYIRIKLFQKVFFFSDEIIYKYCRF